jgi:hypothetical protein
MGIKKLKKENDPLNITIIDMLGKIDVSKTKKYTQFLVKMLNEQINIYNTENVFDERYEPNDSISQVLPRNSLINNYVRTLIDYCFDYGNIKTFIEFTHLMEKGLVEENDISKYDSWDMIKEQTFKAKNREVLKNTKRQTHKIYEDDDYLIFKPLSYLTSVTYGYQTKWCTAMIDNPGYFYSHSLGVLIYLIDKKNTKKFAFHKSINRSIFNDSPDSEMFKTYNEVDKQIDTFQSGLPYNIIKIVSDNISNEGNYKLFCEDELSEMRKYTRIPEEEQIDDEKCGISEEPPIYRLRPAAPLDNYTEDHNYSYDVLPEPQTDNLSYTYDELP